MHNIHDADENYLEALVVLGRELGEVRSIDIANHLSLSRASVSNAIKKLEREGRVRMEPDGTLVLTESGAEIGEQIDLRHHFLNRFFQSIGVSAQQADDDACKAEHAISQETFDRLREAFPDGMVNTNAPDQREEI